MEERERDRAEDGVGEVGFRSAEMETGERAWRSSDARNPCFGHQVAAVARAGDGGHEGGLPAERLTGATSKIGWSTGRNGEQSTTVRAGRGSCWSQSKPCSEERPTKRGQTGTDM